MKTCSMRSTEALGNVDSVAEFSGMSATLVTAMWPEMREPVRRHVLTDVVPFDDAPGLFADLSARRRHVISAAFALPA